MTISLIANDLSQLPPPDAIKALDVEAIIAARKADLVARFAAAGITYDVQTLESDPGVILQEIDAYRELLDKGAINDSVRAVLPAFAKGTNLEAIVARANVLRLDGENDAALLQRYLASFAAPAAGSEDGYIYRIATAWPQVHDVRVLGPDIHGTRGRAQVVLLAADGNPVSAEIIATVFAALSGKSARPLTDIVTVESAQIPRWNCTARLFVRRGPDPSIIAAQAEAALRIVAAARYQIGGSVPLNAASAPLYVSNVVRVEMTTPAAPIDASPIAAPFLDQVVLTTEIVQ